MQRLLLALAGVTAVTSAAAARTPSPLEPASPQQNQCETTGAAGTPPKYAVPDFIALSNEPEIQEAAKTLARGVRDDLAHEREVSLIPRDAWSSVPASRTIDDVQYDRWRELGVDDVIIGSVVRDGTDLKIQVRLYAVNAKESAFAREYVGSAADAPGLAHRIANDIQNHRRASQAWPGVAGLKLTTSSNGANGDRDVATFCCPEYLSTMIQLIQRNWSSKWNVAGVARVKYTIQRDGRLTDIQLDQSSGYFALDESARHAIILTRQLPPLPAQFPEPTLTVHLNFSYER